METFQLSSLTAWDWFILLVLVLSVLLGIFRGMIRTVFGLAAWAVALFGTPMVAPATVQLSKMQQQPWVIYVLLFIFLFVLVRVSGALVARGLGKIGLGGVDRLFGGVIGVARALLLVAVVVVVARMFDMHRHPSWKNSLSRPLLDAIVQAAEPYLSVRPAGLRKI
jgi:membrane protein required for colicin V production